MHWRIEISMYLHYTERVFSLHPAWHPRFFFFLLTICKNPSIFDVRTYLLVFMVSYVPNLILALHLLRLVRDSNGHGRVSQQQMDIFLSCFSDHHFYVPAQLVSILLQ